jgi:transcriptional regulator with XRE-family HTH domain
LILRRRNVSIGETLAEARRQAGLTVTQVSQRTRISESIIRSIELGDFSPCGGDFYARGHIRSIASAVGIDSGPLIHEYDETHGSPGSISAAQVFEPCKPIRIREPRSFGLGKVAMAALVAVICFAGYRLYQAGAHSVSNRAGLASVAARSAGKGAAHPAAVLPTHAARPVHRDVIELTASQSCWVEIIQSGGKVVYNGTLPPGGSMHWTQYRPVLMQLGNPGGVLLKINGKRLLSGTMFPVLLNVTPGKPITATMAGSNVEIPVSGPRH